MNRVKHALLSLLVLVGFAANAQMDDPIQWNSSTKKIDGNKYEIVITATIEEDGTFTPQNYLRVVHCLPILPLRSLKATN